MAKRQFYLDDMERDLLRSALALWKYRLDEQRETSGHGHFYAKHFTIRRIEAMEARLAELPAQTASVHTIPAKAKAAG